MIRIPPITFPLLLGGKVRVLAQEALHDFPCSVFRASILVIQRQTIGIRDTIGAKLQNVHRWHALEVVQSIVGGPVVNGLALITVTPRMILGREDLVVQITMVAAVCHVDVLVDCQVVVRVGVVVIHGGKKW